MRADGEYFVEGRVCNIDISDRTYRFIIENISLDGRKSDGLLVIKTQAAEQSVAEFIRIGDRVSFRSAVKGIDLTSDNGINGSAYRSNIRYKASVNADSIKIEFGSPNFTENILIGIRRLLTENMGGKYGNIAYSMITGDKYYLDDAEFIKYSAVGLAHIMAVSGLHIGFMAMLIFLVFSRIGKKTAYAVTCVILVLYASLVGFSPSVTRAVIMFVISGAAVFLGGRRDLLSSLCCAFSLILAFKPFYLFEAGFLMSFGSIFGITLFANTIRRALNKRRVPDKISNATGATLSASAGIFPAQIYFFHRIHWFGPIVNIFAIPYVSVVFSAIVVCLPIAAIPGLGGILNIAKWLLIPLDTVAGAIAEIPFAVSYLRSNAGIFLCYPIMFCASTYFMLNKGKRTLSLYSAAMCVLLIAVCAL